MSASVTSGTYPRAHPASNHRSRALRLGLQRLGLQRLGISAWQILCQLGSHRAHPELMRLSRLHAQTNPVLSQQLRDAARSLLQA